MLFQLLFQCRHRGLRLCQRSALGQHLRCAECAKRLLARGERAELLGDGDLRARRIQLRAHGRFADGRVHHVGGEAQVRRIALIALRLCLRTRRFHLPPRAAKHVQRIADAELGGA